MDSERVGGASADTRVEQGGGMRKKSPAQMEDAKRNMIDSLEAIRGARKMEPENIHSDELRDQAALVREVRSLRKELKMARAASAMVESDMHRLEQKALEAISEAGSLRKKLDKVESANCPTTEEIKSYIRERDDMMRRVEASEEERVLLMTALRDSESEIARLAKSLDLFSRKFCNS